MCFSISRGVARAIQTGTPESRMKHISIAYCLYNNADSHLPFVRVSLTIYVPG
jgi:hypothetical protein